MFLKVYGLLKKHLQEITMIENVLKKKCINIINNGNVAQLARALGCLPKG